MKQSDMDYLIQCILDKPVEIHMPATYDRLGSLHEFGSIHDCSLLEFCRWYGEMSIYFEWDVDPEFTIETDRPPIFKVEPHHLVQDPGSDTEALIAAKGLADGILLGARKLKKP